MSLSREKRESPVGTGREREGEESSSMSGCLNQKTNKELVLRGYSRRGADGAQAERLNGLARALNLSLPFATMWYERPPQLWDLALLSLPTEIGRKHPSCGLLFSCRGWMYNPYWTVCPAFIYTIVPSRRLLVQTSKGIVEREWTTAPLPLVTNCLP